MFVMAMIVVVQILMFPKLITIAIFISVIVLLLIISAEFCVSTVGFLIKSLSFEVGSGSGRSSAKG